MFKKMIVASAICTMPVLAQAADLPVRAPAPAPIAYAAPMFTWSGFYIGVTGGYAGDKFNYPARVTNPGGPIAPITANASITSSGFLLGGTVGYNYQLSRNFVLGLEADWSWANVDGQIGLGLNAPIGPGITANLSAGSTIDNIGTARVRLGYAWDRALFYATGGFAWGSVDSGANIAVSAGGVPVFAGGLSKSNSITGWVAGVGLEYALSPNWSFKTEYLYADFGKANLYRATYVGFGPGGSDIAASLDVKSKLHIVRAGLNYRFNWGGSAPVVARY